MKQSPGFLKRFMISLLLIGCSKLHIKPPSFFPHLFNCRLSVFLKPGLAPIDVIKTPGNFPGELNVCYLVSAHRHITRAVDENICSLKQRIPEKSVGIELFFLKVLLLILIAGDTLQPTHGRDHGKKQMQLSVLGHFGLDKKRRRPGIDAYGQPVDHHFNDVILEQGRITIVGCQSMPISNEEEALILMLKLNPVLQHPMVMPQMQTTRRSHSR